MELARQPLVYEYMCPEGVQTENGTECMQAGVASSAFLLFFFHELAMSEDIIPLHLDQFAQLASLSDPTQPEYSKLKSTIVQAFGSDRLLALSFLKSPKDVSVSVSDTGKYD